ncbi:MAG: DUF4404 family protein [Pirellulaceae bacterium]|nr:DUF4404 family protein [Planctomycetales bacterium]
MNTPQDPDKLAEVRQKIEELRRLLEQSNAISSEQLEEANTQLTVVAQALEGGHELSGSAETSLADWWRGAASRFEASHPTISGIMERLLHGLGELGI